VKCPEYTKCTEKKVARGWEEGVGERGYNEYWV
jgi:hypothetical protein